MEAHLLTLSLEVHTDNPTIMCVRHAETTLVGSLQIQCMSLGGGDNRECSIDNCMEISFVSSHIANTSKQGQCRRSARAANAVPIFIVVRCRRTTF